LGALVSLVRHPISELWHPKDTSGYGSSEAQRSKQAETASWEQKGCRPTPDSRRCPPAQLLPQGTVRERRPKVRHRH